jgi:hypothetical protein
MLGAFIGAALRQGRDKLTLALGAQASSSLGLWIEQLVAESTGKHGTGALPIVDEPLGRASEYGADRAFVAISTERDEPDAARLAALEQAAGHPVLRLSTRLNGLRRRVLPLGVRHGRRRRHARHQPVRRAERRRGQGEDQGAAGHVVRGSEGGLPEPLRRRRTSDIAVFSGSFTGGGSPAAVVRAAIESVRPPDYVAFLSYLPAGSDVEVAIGEVRAGFGREDARRQHLRRRPAVSAFDRDSTTRGGPNTCVAFVITADDRTDDGDPRGRVQLQGAETRAGARRCPDSRSARPPDGENPSQAGGPRRRVPWAGSFAEALGMKPWTFKREAGWMMWIYLGLPGAAILLVARPALDQTRAGLVRGPEVGRPIAAPASRARPRTPAPRPCAGCCRARPS